MFPCILGLHDLIPTWREACRGCLPIGGLWCEDDEVQSLGPSDWKSLTGAVYANLNGVHISTPAVANSWRVPLSDCHPNYNIASLASIGLSKKNGISTAKPTSSRLHRSGAGLLPIAIHSSVPRFAYSVWVITSFLHHHGGPPGREKLNYGAILNHIWNRLVGRWNVPTRCAACSFMTRRCSCTTSVTCTACE